MAEQLKETVSNQLHIEEAETESQTAAPSKSVALEDTTDNLETVDSPSPGTVAAETPAVSENVGESLAVAASSEAVAETVEQSPEIQDDQSDASKPSAGQNANVASVSEEAAMPAAEEAVNAETVSDTSASQEETFETKGAAAEQPAAGGDNPLLHVGILVYYLKKEGSDKRIKKKLLDAGYTDVVAKGKWPGAFKDQNVFFRNEDQPGVKEIMDVLGKNWFDYYFNGPRISRSVKKIFGEDDHVQFLIIPK